MRIHWADVMTGLGAALTAPAVTGVCCALVQGHGLPQGLVGMVVMGCITATAGLVSRYESQRRAWAQQSEAALQARRQSQRLHLTAPEATGTTDEALTLVRARRSAPGEQPRVLTAGVPVLH